MQNSTKRRTRKDDLANSDAKVPAYVSPIARTSHSLTSKNPPQWLGMGGNGQGKQASHGQGANQHDFHRASPSKKKALMQMLPMGMPERYNFRVIIIQYITEIRSNGFPMGYELVCRAIAAFPETFRPRPHVGGYSHT
jgi:hypothetical protein